MLGVRAVLAESFERIHLANLICMGILPLRFTEGNASSHGFNASHMLDVRAVRKALTLGADPLVRVCCGDQEFTAEVLIRTSEEREYFRHGGLLPYVARSLVHRGS